MEFTDRSHFVLQFMKFVSVTVNKPFPLLLQNLLDKYPDDKVSYLTDNIQNSVRGFLNKYERGTSSAHIDHEGNIIFQGEKVLIKTPEHFLNVLFVYSAMIRSMVENPNDYPHKFHATYRYLLESLGQFNLTNFWERVNREAIKYLMQIGEVYMDTI